MPINTKKKGNKFSAISSILMVLFCIAIIVCVFILKDEGNASYKGNIKRNFDVEDLNEGWTDATNRNEFTSFGDKIEKEKLVLEHDLTFANEKLDSFAFYTYFSAVKVEVIENPNSTSETIVLLDEYGNEGSFENKKLLGDYYLIVHIPHNVDRNGTLRVTFYSGNNEIYVKGFEYGVEADITKALIIENFMVIVTALLAIVFVVVLLALKCSKRTGKFITLSYVYFTIFFVICAIWEVLDSQYLMILGLPAGSVCFAESEFYMLVPIGFLQFTNATCKWKKKGRVFNGIFLALVIVNFVATNISVLAGFHTFLDIVFSTHIVFVLTVLNSIIQVLANWFRSFNTNNVEINKEKKYLGFVFLGGIVFTITVLIQVIRQYFFDSTESSTSFIRYGIFFFGIIIIFSIINRINDAVEAERKENMNKIWEEKQKVEDIRTIMNEALKTIIPDQYIEEVIEAYKKKNRIKNNSIDGTVPEEDMILKIGHSRRLATILVSDIRGFSEISTKYDQRVGDMLSHYLGTMTDIVEKYGGHVLEFMGDGILAGFGTIEQDKYQADNAVKAAIEMQSTMPEINSWNESNGFPGQLEIGIGINTGNVFAGIIGSLERFKFDVLGREVNLASRIESFTTGGQVLIAQKTKESIIEPVGTYDIIKATPKGFDTEQTYYLVNAVGDMKYEVKGEDFTPFRNPIEVKFSVFEDKGNAKKTFSGTVTEMSEHAIILKTTALLDIFDIVKVIHNGGVTCKVTKIEERGYTLRFTSSNKRNDGRPIFEDQEQENNQFDELDPETRKLMKKKKDDYTF